MLLNSMHLRFGVIAGGVILLGLYLVMGGTFGGAEVVQLDFGMYPEVLEGCPVEIDGKVVGTLARTGGTTRVGFDVDPGRHVVRILHASLGSEHIEVDVAAGRKARLLLDMVAHYDSRTGLVSTRIGVQ
jgi:hypothetical protein